MTDIFEALHMGRRIGNLEGQHRALLRLGGVFLGVLTSAIVGVAIMFMNNTNDDISNIQEDLMKVQMTLSTMQGRTLLPESILSEESQLSNAEALDILDGADKILDRLTP